MIELLSSGLGAKILLGSGVLAYLYSLYLRYQSAIQKATQAEVAQKLKGEFDDIAQKAKVADESHRDFDDAVNKFNNDNK